MGTNFTGITFDDCNVSPSDDGIINRTILPDGILSGCEISYSGSTLTMASGTLIACGRQFRHPAAQNWAVVDATTGYARLLITLDLTRSATDQTFDQVVEAVEYANDISGFPALVQQDINVAGTKYQIVACVVSLGTGGISGIINTMPTVHPASADGGTLTVTAPAGATVTATKDGKTLTRVAGADGVVVFRGLESGTWTVKIQLGTDVAEDTVQLVTDYTKEMFFVKIYGISRDITSPSPAWAREDDAVGKTATASVGTVAGSSDFDSCYPWSGIHRETLSTGDVMVKIPKFWFQRYREGNVEYIKIADKAATGFTLHPAFKHGGVECDHIYVGAYKTSSNNKSVTGASPQVSQTRATMRSNAKNKGTGWSLIDISALSAIQMLMLVEFADNNMQSKIGRGYCDGNSAALKTGSCDSVSNLTGRPAGTDGMVDVIWRGIEGFWGNVWEWVDGLNCNNGAYYVCNDISKYADDTDTGYDQLSYAGATNWLQSYITVDGLDTGNNPHVIMPKAAGSGSESTYECDACWSSTGWRVFCRGGAWTSGSPCGLFAADFSSGSSYSYTHLGSRLLYIPPTEV